MVCVWEHVAWLHRHKPEVRRRDSRRCGRRVSPMPARSGGPAGVFSRQLGEGGCFPIRGSWMAGRGQVVRTPFNAPPPLTHGVRVQVPPAEPREVSRLGRRVAAHIHHTPEGASVVSVRLGQRSSGPGQVVRCWISPLGWGLHCMVCEGSGPSLPVTSLPV